MIKKLFLKYMWMILVYFGCFSLTYAANITETNNMTFTGNTRVEKGVFIGDGAGLTNLPSGAGDVTTAQWQSSNRVLQAQITTNGNNISSLSNTVIGKASSSDLTTLSNNLIQINVNLSNNLVTMYVSADAILSNNLVALYTAADTILSNLINGKVGNTEFQNSNTATRALIDAKTNSIILAGANMTVTAVTNGAVITYTLASTGGGGGGGDMMASTYDPANGNRQVAFSNDLATVSNLLAGKASSSDLTTLSNALVTLYTGADTVLSNLINGKVGFTEFYNSNTAQRAYTDGATNQVTTDYKAYVNSNLVGSIIAYWCTNRFTNPTYTNNAGVGTNIFDACASYESAIHTNLINTTSIGSYIAALIYTNQSFASVPAGLVKLDYWCYESDAGSVGVEPELYLVGVDSGTWYEFGETVVAQTVPTSVGRLSFTIPYPESTVTTERVFMAIKIKITSLSSTPVIRQLSGNGYATHFEATLPVGVLTDGLMPKSIYDVANGARQVAFSNDLAALSNFVTTKANSSDLTTLSNNLVALYTGADTALSNALVALYTGADTALSNALVALYSGADTALSNNLIAYDVIQDAALSNAILVIATNGANLKVGSVNSNSFDAATKALLGAGGGADGTVYRSSNNFVFANTTTTNWSLDVGQNNVLVNKAWLYHSATNGFPSSRVMTLSQFGSTNRTCENVVMQHTNLLTLGMFNINPIDNGTQTITVADTTGLKVGDFVCIMGPTNEFCQVTNVTATTFTTRLPLTLVHSQSSGVSRVCWLPINSSMDTSGQSKMTLQGDFPAAATANFVTEIWYKK